MKGNQFYVWFLFYLPLHAIFGLSIIYQKKKKLLFYLSFIFISNCTNNKIIIDVRFFSSQYNI